MRYTLCFRLKNDKFHKGFVRVDKIIEFYEMQGEIDGIKRKITKIAVEGVGDRYILQPLGRAIRQMGMELKNSEVM